MASSIAEALQRTALSECNQMEMLTFRLTDRQLYGINVFKIIEIIECPRSMDRIPCSHPAVKGALDFRGSAIAAIDLSEAVGLPAKDFRNEPAYIIICEYNRRLTAFIIHTPETLLTRNWLDIHKPEGINAASLVAIAYADNQETILLLDIETVLATIVGVEKNLETAVMAEKSGKGNGKHVLVVDDSKTALMLLQSVLDRLGFAHTSMMSAPQALDYLQKHGNTIDLVISDIEMPGMDGFSFTRAVRERSEFSHFKIILHSSMSNDSNRVKAEQAGADDFVAKFDPDVLAQKIFAMLASP